jgi:hypothetical protein
MVIIEVYKCNITMHFTYKIHNIKDRFGIVYKAKKRSEKKKLFI